MHILERNAEKRLRKKNKHQIFASLSSETVATGCEKWSVFQVNDYRLAFLFNL